MNRLCRSLLVACTLLYPLLALAQAPGAAAASAAETTTKAGAAAVVIEQQRREPPAADFLEGIVDSILEVFNITTGENTLTHYIVAGFFIVAGFLFRRILTRVIFDRLKRLAARTNSTLDDKLFPALEQPAATFVVLFGIFGGLKVLKLDERLDLAVDYGSTVAFSLAIFWGFSRALGAVLDHAHELAVARGSGVAPFMPWIKKAVVTVFVIFGVLMIVQGLGADVGALLTGLGIGGLAFALAAQDTLANVFGAIVVAIDQPFRIGETITITGRTGTVEDVGIRSTRLRLVDKSLLILPNKLVAAEAIANNSRFTGRRVEHLITLTYNTTPAQMEEFVQEVRRIVKAGRGVRPESVMVYFRDFNASSLDLWVVYEFPSPDFGASMEARQAINLAIMRAVESRGLSFAFPTQTIRLERETPPSDGAPARTLPAPGPLPARTSS